MNNYLLIHSFNKFHLSHFLFFFWRIWIVCFQLLFLIKLVFFQEAMKLLHRYVPWVDISIVADRMLPYLVCYYVVFSFVWEYLQFKYARIYFSDQISVLVYCIYIPYDNDFWIIIFYRLKWYPIAWSKLNVKPFIQLLRY